MKGFFPGIPDSVKRLFVVFILLMGGILLVWMLLPSSLKERKLYVQSTLEREMSRKVRYAGSDICADCHEEYNLKKSGYHKNLSCETCHGTAKEHADNPTEIRPLVPKLRDLCARCHIFDPSRPTGFPQINPISHNPLKPCAMCHNPHDPKPPTVPRECQACHAEIARIKAVSSHVMLECTSCHQVPKGHKITPRNVKATIPADREFCGKCHSDKSTVKATPKINLDTHGEKYLCWQCHYPHTPKVE